ncbi:hypothetical protein CLD22_03220 [Rubrivivax gelatinosus]|nr:hypothetical protein [Rubrivivax gelatinosus]
MRLRDTRLRSAAVADAVGAALQALPGCRSLRTNPGAASLVLEYDAAVRDEAAMHRAVLDAVAPWLAAAAAAAPAAAAPPTRRPLSRKRRVNRWAKYGMMATLGGSLAAAAAGARAAHVLTGAAFLGFLGVHVVGYRRTLLR